MTVRKPKRMTARKKPKRKTAGKKTFSWGKKSIIGQNVELYGSAYRTALSQISPLQKREQPDISLRLHASIRRQLKEGATDPSFIASEALKDLDETSEAGTAVDQKH